MGLPWGGLGSPGAMVWRDFLQDYWAGIRQTPQLLRRLPFRRRSLEEELNEALLRGNLMKTFSTFGLTMFGLGITVGTGVTTLSSMAAGELTGPLVTVAYIVAGLLTFFGAACYGELSVAYPVSGAAFSFAMVTFGEAVAWVTVATYFLQYFGGMSVVSRSLSQNISRLAGQDAGFLQVHTSSGWTLDPMAMGAVYTASIVLSLSSRQSSLAISAVTCIKLVVFFVVGVAAYTKWDGANLSPFVRAGAGGQGLWSAVAVLSFTLVGFDSIANASEEARPTASLPAAMLLCVGTATLLYFFLSLGLVAMMPSALQTRQGGFFAAFVYSGIPAFSKVVSVGAILGILTGLFVGLFAVARLTMVFARDWMLPPPLARIGARTQTPVVAQSVAGLIIGLIALMVPADYLNPLVSFAQLLNMYIVVNAQLVRRYYPETKLRFTTFGTAETVAPAPPPQYPGSLRHRWSMEGGGDGDDAGTGSLGDGRHSGSLYGSGPLPASSASPGGSWGPHRHSRAQGRSRLTSHEDPDRGDRPRGEGSARNGKVNAPDRLATHGSLRSSGPFSVEWKDGGASKEGSVRGGRSFGSREGSVRGGRGPGSREGSARGGQEGRFPAKALLEQAQADEAADKATPGRGEEATGGAGVEGYGRGPRATGSSPTAAGAPAHEASYNDSSPAGSLPSGIPATVTPPLTPADTLTSGLRLGVNGRPAQAGDAVAARVPGEPDSSPASEGKEGASPALTAPLARGKADGKEDDDASAPPDAGASPTEVGDANTVAGGRGRLGFLSRLFGGRRARGEGTKGDGAGAAVAATASQLAEPQPPSHAERSVRGGRLWRIRDTALGAAGSTPSGAGDGAQRTPAATRRGSSVAPDALSREGRGAESGPMRVSEALAGLRAFRPFQPVRMHIGAPEGVDTPSGASGALTGGYPNPMLRTESEAATMGEGNEADAGRLDAELDAEEAEIGGDGAWFGGYGEVGAGTYDDTESEDEPDTDSEDEGDAESGAGGGEGTREGEVGGAAGGTATAAAAPRRWAWHGLAWPPRLGGSRWGRPYRRHLKRPTRRLYRRHLRRPLRRFVRRHVNPPVRALLRLLFWPRRRIDGLSRKARRAIAVGHIISVSVSSWALAILYWSTVDRNGTRVVQRAGCSAMTALWLLCTLSLFVCCRPQRVGPGFKIPDAVMPFVPSAAVALCCFCMSSLDAGEYWKVLVWYSGAAVFYFLFSLPMSYIKHYRLDFVNTEQFNVVDLVYRDGQWQPSDGTASRMAGTALHSGGGPGAYAVRAPGQGPLAGYPGLGGGAAPSPWGSGPGTLDGTLDGSGGTYASGFGGNPDGNGSAFAGQLAGAGGGGAHAPGFEPHIHSVPHPNYQPPLAFRQAGYRNPTHDPTAAARRSALLLASIGSAPASGRTARELALTAREAAHAHHATQGDSPLRRSSGPQSAASPSTPSRGGAPNPSPAAAAAASAAGAQASASEPDTPPQAAFLPTVPESEEPAA